MLRELGADASATGRNDILVDGKKVSGNAFYHIPGRSIVHGTMLYDTDMDNMLQSITPPTDKLESKGVDSVRQRIALLKDYIDIDINELKAHARRTLCDGTYQLTEADVEQIEKIEHDVYLSQDFISGNNPRYTLTRRRRIDGVGGIEARIEIKGDTIKQVTLSGDFFSIGDVDAMLSRLTGVKLDVQSIDKALPDNTGNVIMNLKKEDFVSLLAGDEF